MSKYKNEWMKINKNKKHFLILYEVAIKYITI